MFVGNYLCVSAVDSRVGANTSVCEMVSAAVGPVSDPFQCPLWPNICVFLCAIPSETVGNKMVAEFQKHRLKDKEADMEKMRQIRMRILQVEYQGYRAATALLSLGPALHPDVIMVKPEHEMLSWFEWAVAGQKEGIPALKYLMRNHYGLILQSVLMMLYSEQFVVILVVVWVGGT